MASVIDVTLVYKERLKRRQRRVMAEMLRDWQRIEANLIALGEEIGEKIRIAVEVQGITPDRVWLYQQQRATELLDQARAFMGTFSEKYAPYIVQESRGAAIDGVKMAAQQLRVSTAFSTSLSIAAVEAIAAETTFGPVAKLLTSIDVEGIFRDALLRGVARGTNPRAVASEVARATNLAKQRTLTIARTEMARAQRSATYDAYRNIGVTTWQWLSGRDATTCAACWAMDGTTYNAYEEIDDHPNGRCAIVPVTDGPELSEVKSREEAWRDLSESQKLKVLGPSRYDLVSKNPEALAGMATIGNPNEWGRSISVTPLADLAV